MIFRDDRLLEGGCDTGAADRVCRSRGGESCAFDGAMIVLQPIADAVHLVHGPIACCGNTWEGRGSVSSKGVFHKMGFTTDMSELDIVYGSEEKLRTAIGRANEQFRPRAIFVHATCVSGLTGEDIGSACSKAQAELDIPVIPVHAPGFVGPKNLGNRIAGEVLLDAVIGTGEPPSMTDLDINLIGEYNIAGDLRGIEPLFERAGVRVLSRITGDASYEEITWAHRAKLNVVVCGRALINVAREMKRRYGIPYVEVSFFGKTEIARALRTISLMLQARAPQCGISEKVEEIIAGEERKLDGRLKEYSHLFMKRAVLYTGGVKSWSFISALIDLGLFVVAVGTKKSTHEDEEKMREILGEDAPLIEDVSPGRLKRIMRERCADVLIAGGRNLYLAMKEGMPFVDVNQERHAAYAGYEGLVTFARDIHNSMRFFQGAGEKGDAGTVDTAPPILDRGKTLVVDPLKHSQSIGAAIALQGIEGALPVIHGAQGCNFLAKVLITRHFREPIALQSTKVFTEDVVMGSEDRLVAAVTGALEKERPALAGVISTGLTEVKGDDMQGALQRFRGERAGAAVLSISTPDYEGSLEWGYASAVKAVVEEVPASSGTQRTRRDGQINILAGSFLTPADCMELREISESFGFNALILPDLAALDGSRTGFSPLAEGGITVEEIACMGDSAYTIAIGASMEAPALVLRERFGIEYSLLQGIAGLRDMDTFTEMLSALSGIPVPRRYGRQRNALIDGMRDAHFYLGGKKVCLALEPDHAVQVSRVIEETGATLVRAVIPCDTGTPQKIAAQEVRVGDLGDIDGDVDLLIANSHAEERAKTLGVPLYQMGFPVFKVLGYTTKVFTGYKGSLTMVNDMATLLL